MLEKSLIFSVPCILVWVRSVFYCKQTCFHEENTALPSNWSVIETFSLQWLRYLKIYFLYKLINDSWRQKKDITTWGFDYRSLLVLLILPWNSADSLALCFFKNVKCSFEDLPSHDRWSSNSVKFLNIISVIRFTCVQNLVGYNIILLQTYQPDVL